MLNLKLCHEPTILNYVTPNVMLRTGPLEMMLAFDVLFTSVSL